MKWPVFFTPKDRLFFADMASPITRNASGLLVVYYKQQWGNSVWVIHASDRFFFRFALHIVNVSDVYSRVPIIFSHGKKQTTHAQDAKGGQDNVNDTNSLRLSCVHMIIVRSRVCYWKKGLCAYFGVKRPIIINNTNLWYVEPNQHSKS